MVDYNMEWEHDSGSWRGRRRRGWCASAGLPSRLAGRPRVTHSERRDEHGEIEG